MYVPAPLARVRAISNMDTVTLWASLIPTTTKEGISAGSNLAMTSLIGTLQR